MNYAFNCCYSLESLVIPPCVEDFSWAFEGTRITNIHFPAGTKNISHSFMDSQYLKSAFIPKSVTDLYEAFEDKSVGYMEIRKYTDDYKSAYRSKGEQIIYGFKIKGFTGSAAEDYAKNNGIPFVAL